MSYAAVATCGERRIDLGKRDLHATLLQGDRSASKSVPNSQVGIAQLQTWLKNRNAERVHACLEATGGWSEQVTISLAEAGHVISIVNPARIKAFAQSEMVRTKTDGVDAALIARFCRLHQPEPWKPPAPEIPILQGLVRRQHSLIQMRVDEENRRAAPIVSPAVTASIDAALDHLERELERVDQEIAQLFDAHPTLRRQRELLISIPGIAGSTAAGILGEMPNITEFRDVKAIAAYAGLSPRLTSPARSNIVAGSRNPVTLTCGAIFTSQRFRQCVSTRPFARSLNA